MPFFGPTLSVGTYSKLGDAPSNIGPIGLSPLGSDLQVEQALLLELTYDYLLFTQNLTNQFFLFYYINATFQRASPFPPFTQYKTYFRPLGDLPTLE